MKRKRDDRFINVALSTAPIFAKKGQKRNANQHKGNSYERRVFEFLRDTYPAYNVKQGQWIRYQEYSSKRIKYCQPDVLIKVDDLAMGIIVECKLTYRSAAKTKLRSLYLPLCKILYPEIQTWYTVQICKNLTLQSKKLKRVITEFKDLEKTHETLLLRI